MAYPYHGDPLFDALRNATAALYPGARIPETAPLIDRVARAIFDSVPGLPPVCAWEDLAAYAQENYRAYAKAAIAALAKARGEP